MKGVIFNVVEEVVVSLWDDDTWDDLLDDAGLDGSYTALGNYGDEELLALVDAAHRLTEIPVPSLLETIGEHATVRLAERLPGAAEDAGSAREFILRVNDIIHPEVKKLYPQAIPPVFEFTEHTDDDGLVVEYRSRRGLDALAIGLLRGCGHLYGEPVDVDRVAGSTSTFRVSFKDA
ncbi:MAG: heme NO-binding domain-containing protein [Actinomycetota bacterium]